MGLDGHWCQALCPFGVCDQCMQAPGERMTRDERHYNARPDGLPKKTGVEMPKGKRERSEEGSSVISTYICLLRRKKAPLPRWPETSESHTDLP